MDCKRLLGAAVLLFAAVSCSQRYELEIPIALNREEMRFTSSGNSYYVMVSSEGAWTASLDKDAPWLSFSRLEGNGNAQIMVSASLNTGVSRGVTLTVSNSHGSREMYISQESGLADGGLYGLVKESVNILKAAGTARISAGTNLDDATIGGALPSVTYKSGEEQWIHDIVVTASRVSFSYDENVSGEPRSATVTLTFPLARWDAPVTAFFDVNQSMNTPATVQASISALPGAGTPAWEAEAVIALLDSDGSTMIPAFRQDGGDTFLFNADAVQGGIAAAVYPEDCVNRLSGGKAFISLPAVQPYISSPDAAASLVLLAATRNGDVLDFRCAGSLLKLNIGGSGTLRSLGIMASLPISGGGTIDFNAAQPIYEPDAATGSSSLDVILPEGGVSLPASMYLMVPAAELGHIAVNATTDSWSGSVTLESGVTGRLHEIIPVEEVSFSIPASAADLSKGAPANCYLVENPESAFYSVDIRKPDGSIPASDINRCAYLWQSAPDVFDYLCIDAAAGKLYFRKGASRPGNALVGVMNDEGTVRWSIHIWAPATSVESRRFGNWTLMDRNLGAVEAAAADQSGSSIGMHYQWGRKDPFPPVAKMGDTNHGKVYPDNIAFVTAQDGVSQETADAHPTTYYWGSGASGKQDWRDVQDDGLWDLSGTNNNPCPRGWAVAPREALELVAEKMKSAQFVARQGITINDDDGKSVLFAPGGWYRRSQNATQQLANTSEGFIWTSTPLVSGGFGGAYRLWFQSTVNNRRVDDNYPQRRWGANVRCVKIQ